MEEGAGTGWTVEYAAYYGDIIVKNSAQCEEIHDMVKGIIITEGSILQLTVCIIIKVK